MYRERPSRLDGTILWTAAADPGEENGNVLPDGCMDLIWDGGELLVAGPDTRAHPVTRPAGVRYTGLRFPPGTGPVVFGVPACELRDTRLPLAGLWPAAYVAELAERIAPAAAPGRALEEVAAARLRAAPPPDPAHRRLAAALRDGRTVADLAREEGIGERRLHRRCLAAFGYGPKTLARVLRMERALRLARGGLPLAEVAARAGYADQAHLTREVKALTGSPPGALLSG
jgi:AraC-like DNA-binding protein